VIFVILFVLRYGMMGPVERHKLTVESWNVEKARANMRNTKRECCYDRGFNKCNFLTLSICVATQAYVIFYHRLM
jgi:hypothetical protein